MAWLCGLVLAVLAAGGAALDDDLAELAAALRASCVEEEGADPALIDRVNAGADLVPDPKLKCYIKCVMETAGMMADGEVDVEAILAMLPAGLRARTEPAMRACGTQRGADACDTAFRTQRCWQQANRQDYMLV